MVTVAALEAIRTGTTTIVENAGGIGPSAAALAQTGLRCVFAESVRDSENVAGPMSPEGLARSEAPQVLAEAARRRPAAHRRSVHAWHGKNQGRISVFPAAALAETSSPELLQAVRAFARSTTSATRSICRRAARSRLHGAAPRPASAGVSRQGADSSARGCSPRTADMSTTPTSRCWAARARSCRTRRPWRRIAASFRRSRSCERPAARSPTAPTTTPTICSR